MTRRVVYYCKERKQAEMVMRNTASAYPMLTWSIKWDDRKERWEVIARASDDLTEQAILDYIWTTWLAYQENKLAENYQSN